MEVAMSFILKVHSRVLACVLALCIGGTAVSFATAPDNSAVNERERETKQLTAENQGMSEQETEMTRKIRVALTEDESLSTYAKNVKIITQGGKVTLKGPVSSMKEKNIIQKKAEKFAEHYRVVNQLTVAGNAQTK